MCKAYRDLIADERAEARQEGIQQGIQQGIRQFISCLERIKNGSSKQELLAEGFAQEVVEQAWTLRL